MVLYFSVCYVYKTELKASANVIQSLLSKAHKYDWAKEAHEVALQEREFMANVLFDALCSIDDKNYYFDLFNSAVEDQISALISNL